VLSGIKKLREPKKLPSWLYTIARNTALGHLRKKYKRQELFEPDAIVRRSELNTREKLLEIEYCLAELAEKLKAAETND
jgi:DNA-directed RNA polymerase specialized sigma24 family protein